ncbi:MAG: hypothetical protein QXM16_00960 [Nitrososphaerota archaeon]
MTLAGSRALAGQWAEGTQPSPPDKAVDRIGDVGVGSVRDNYHQSLGRRL